MILDANRVIIIEIKNAHLYTRARTCVFVYIRIYVRARNKFSQISLLKNKTNTKKRQNIKITKENPLTIPHLAYKGTLKQTTQQIIKYKATISNMLEEKNYEKKLSHTA